MIFFKKKLFLAYFKRIVRMEQDEIRSKENINELESTSCMNRTAYRRGKWK